MDEATNLGASAQDQGQAGATEGTGAADLLFGKQAESTDQASEGEGGDKGNEDGDAGSSDQQGKETDQKEKTDDDGKSEDGKKSDEEEKKESDGAPEAYEKFALPEGFDYDDERTASFSELAKDANLSQEKAQKFVDLLAEMQKQDIGKAQEAQRNYEKKLQEEAMADPDIGGKNWKGKAEANVSRAIDYLGGPELRKLIGENPALGNHVVFLKTLNRAGALLSEDRVAEARAGVSGEKPAAEDVLFDKK